MKSLLSKTRRARPLLGTLVEIGAEGENAAAAIDAAFDEIGAVHRLMSFHESTSDISRLNRAPLGIPLQVDPRTHEVLAWAERMSVLSGGIFDVTVGARLVAAGFLPAPDAEWPSGERSFHDVRLLPDNRVSLRRRVWIDLGGIAKGYAVDRAIDALKQNGVEHGIVNAGGDLRVFGAPQPIHLRHPEDAGRLLCLGELSNTAIASSSGCFTERSERSDHSDPLVDPRRNAAIRWQQSITVIAPQCVIADALTKIVRIAPRQAARVLPELDAEAIVIDRRGDARRLAVSANEVRADRVIGAKP
jgi:thiamine biosynthesis lipoprotein